MITESVTVLSVSELTAWIKDRLESDPRLSGCWVAGEVSNFKWHSSGHMYFTLKDEKSRIRAVMFASRTRNLAFVPEDGMRVICTGSIGVFERDGQYQLYVEQMQPDGIGALYVAFTQLRDRLAQEGLFDAARKRPLPAFPRRIGVVTSPTGAVIRDICTTLARRYPLAKVVLAPALVQGPEAAPSVVAALDQLIRLPEMGYPPVDVIIVGRGGGSLEELWPFNEEVVARAIAACPIPVVSAVGHETDVTICDFVADVRAATPTAAAELVAPHVQELRQQCLQWQTRAAQALAWRLEASRRRWEAAYRSPVLQNPLRLVDVPRQHVDFLEAGLRRAVGQAVAVARRQLSTKMDRLYRVSVSVRLQETRRRLERLEQAARERTLRRLLGAQAALDRVIAQLEGLNPLAVLRRGYSVVYRADGQTVVHSARQLTHGERIQIRMVDGMVSARVEEKGATTSDERGSGQARYDGAEQLRLDI